MELRAERGQAVLVGAPERFLVPAGLAGALDEWAEVAGALGAEAGSDRATAELVSWRGRQLAARLAATTGTTVGYHDPVLGVVQDVSPAGAEPTPWATGLTVSAFAAAIVVTAMVTLVRGLAEVTWLLGALGLLVVTGGLAPTIWLARHTPLWRWVGLGFAVGLALSWVAVILATLGP